MATERDWKDLPPELIHLISRKLDDLRYFIRCRVVCRTWFSATLLSDPPLQKLPWLIECKGKFPDATPLKEELRFYSFVTNETSSIPIAKTHQGKAYYRPDYIYLLVVDDGAISLFNPLTDKVISLPPLPPDSRNIRPIFSGEDPTCNWLLHVVFHRSGPWRSNFVTFHPESMGWKYYSKYNIPKPKDEPRDLLGRWIVESGGAFLRASLSFKDYKGVSDLEASIFHVYVLNFEGERGQPCWVRVSSIGDQILFLDYKTGLSARERTAGLKGNCIYFIVEDDSPLGTGSRGLSFGGMILAPV